MIGEMKDMEVLILADNPIVDASPLGNLKKLVYSVLPAKKADFMVEVGALTNQSFYNSITGQIRFCLVRRHLRNLLNVT